MLKREANGEAIKDAKTLLSEIGDFKKVTCNFRKKPEQKKQLYCKLERAVRIRDVELIGIPLRMLKADIEKRVFLRRGSRLDELDVRGDSARERQRQQLVRHLERAGYYGADVLITSEEAGAANMVDVQIEIRGGNFIHVADVKVKADESIESDVLEAAYSSMCLGGDGLLSAFETWEIACLTKDRLRETTSKLEAVLQRKGYPEARLRVKTAILDAEKVHDGLPGCSWSASEKAEFSSHDMEVPPRCATLDVRVTSGPRLVSKIFVHDATHVDDSIRIEEVLGFAKDTTDWLNERTQDVVSIIDENNDIEPFGVGSLFQTVQPMADFIVSTRSSLRVDFFEPITVALQEALGRDLSSARDSVVYATDLENRLTFSRSKSVDAVEAEASRGELVDALRRRGYFNARVTSTYEKEDDEVRIQYHVFPGPLGAVREIRFIGNDGFKEDVILEDVELSTKLRTVTSRGFTARASLARDAERIVEFYEARGFRDADVTYHGFQSMDGYIDIEFHIDEGDPYLLGSVRFIGGINALNIAARLRMIHCTGESIEDPTNPLLPPITPEGCVGRPFRPDQIVADERRVLDTYVGAGYLYTKVRIEPEFTDKGPGLVVLIAGRDESLDELHTQSHDGAVHEDEAVAKAESPTTPPVAAAIDGADAENESFKSVHVGEVLLDGNERTERDVLMREFGEIPTTVRPAQFLEGVRRLRRTGLFRRVDLDYVGVAGESEAVHLKLAVEESPALTWDTSAAFSTNTLFSVRNELRDRNLFGRMLDLTLVADLGLFIGRDSIVSTSLRWPRFLGLPFTLSLTPSVRYQDRPVTYVSREPGAGGPIGVVSKWGAPDVRRRNLRVDYTFSIESKPFPGKDFTVALDNEYRLEWDDATLEL